MRIHFSAVLPDILKEHCFFQGSYASSTSVSGKPVIKMTMSMDH